MRVSVTLLALLAAGTSAIAEPQARSGSASKPTARSAAQTTRSASTGLDWAVQGGISLPQGDLSTLVDSKIGFVLGVQAAMNVNWINKGGSEFLVPRLDLAIHSGSPVPGLDYSSKQFLLGADYQYYFDGRAHQGPYVLGGLGLGFMNFSADPGLSRSENAIFFALGGGYAFDNRSALEGRLVSVSYDGGLSASTLNLAYVFRF